jgi:AmmeMemoRadiSam system radical SAM enzyme/AmmeMemoRadiSam system protein B/AmmeMemoRadiSam system protein A
MTLKSETPNDSHNAPRDRSAADWWKPLKSDKQQNESDEPSLNIACELCPRGCVIRPSKRGFCFVRKNEDGRLISTTYGHSTGFCVDPIEKKPLHQFYPGTPILSFGTAGCNLGCVYCQNWTSSHSKQVASGSEVVEPEAIVAACHDLKIPAVAYTYNEPIIWAEYATKVARLCREEGINNVAVTNGYVRPKPRIAFFENMDAANVDLKAFSETFYKDYTDSRLAPVLDTLVYLAKETDVWFELTNLVIPGANDDLGEIRRMCDWIVENLGPQVPLHFSAFHPTFRLTDRPRTPHSTLIAAYDVAREAGLHYVYTGNVVDPERQRTDCPHCGETIIRREGYQLTVYRLNESTCAACGGEIAGRFADKPGDWGSRRQPVNMSDFAHRVSRNVDAALSPSKARKEHAMTDASKPQGPGSQAPLLTPDQEQSIFQTTGRRVAAAVYREPGERLASVLSEAASLPLIGAFVSLKRSGRLRSCCGTMAPTIPLHEALNGAAVRAATDDPRFPPISASELGHLDMEVWLLWGMKPVDAKGKDRVNAVEIGRHGVQISKGHQRGLLLPGVAIEHEMDAPAFLDAVCRKANLPLDAWRNDDQTVLSTFEGLAISGPFSSVELGGENADELPGPNAPAWPGGPSPAHLQALTRHCLQNFHAVKQGAVPTFYAPQLFEAGVAGALLFVTLPGKGNQATLTFSRIGTRSDLPLQGTLFELVREAVVTTSRQVPPAALAQVQLGIAILNDAAMHGSLQEPDLDGIDAARRSILINRPGQWSIAFNTASQPEELIETAIGALDLAANEDGALISFATASTTPTFQAATNPPRRAESETDVRPPAVAGRFYPGSPAEIDTALDDMIPENTEKVDWPAAVVIPHAGWVYSGRLAAKTLSKVAIPKRVLIVSPRHTPHGTDFALAPHGVWGLPGKNVNSDPEWARRLAEQVDAFELDASAHADEHSIEVQLPILARLADAPKIVGLTVARPSLETLQEAAKQLADAISEMETPPLLVVSTDMNHFADLETTKRVDALALDAIEALDPFRLYNTVNDNEISMCGVSGCVLFMETLKHLGRLTRCERVGYTTSAEASGGSSRVVGYAGLLLG